MHVKFAAAAATAAALIMVWLTDEHFAEMHERALSKHPLHQLLSVSKLKN
jgi:hypothetical protein